MALDQQDLDRVEGGLAQPTDAVEFQDRRIRNRSIDDTLKARRQVEVAVNGPAPQSDRISRIFAGSGFGW